MANTNMEMYLSEYNHLLLSHDTILLSLPISWLRVAAHFQIKINFISRRDSSGSAARGAAGSRQPAMQRVATIVHSLLSHKTKIELHE